MLLAQFRRRSAAVPPTSPPTTSGMVLWLPAPASDVTLVSGNISAITSRDSLPALLSQSTSSRQPAWAATGLNSMPAIHPDGVDDSLIVTSGGGKVSLPSGHTMGALIKTTSTKSTSSYAGDPGNTILGDVRGNVNLGFGVESGKLTYRHFNGSWNTTQGTTSVNTGAQFGVMVTHDSASGVINLYVNSTGSSEATSTHAYSSANDQVSIVGNGFVSSDSFDGFIRNPIVFNRVLNSSELSGVMAWLVST